MKLLHTNPKSSNTFSRLTPDRRTRYALISHAYTPETEQVRLAFEQAGLHVIPVFGPKDYGHKNCS